MRHQVQPETASAAPSAPGRILVGTTSWTEKTLLTLGHFYPPEVKNPEERLRYYAAQFPIVEVDSTYYAIPSERNATQWSERTAPGFVFDVKSYRLFTRHKTPVRSLPADLRQALGTRDTSIYYDKVPAELQGELWRRFRAALEPLRASSRLGVVLFQFAPWLIFGTLPPASGPRRNSASAPRNNSTSSGETSPGVAGLDWAAFRTQTSPRVNSRQAAAVVA